MTSYVDPLNGEMVYSEYDTIAMGIQHTSAREIGVRGFSRHNKVFDALREPDILLPLFFAIPCFLRILEESVYDLLKTQIIEEYGDLDDFSLPPLVVIGDRKLHDHPLIFMSNKETAKSCWNIYQKCRRRAKRLAKKEHK